MQYSDTSTYQGIVQDIDFLLFGKSNIASDYVIADKTRNVNRHLDDVVSIILGCDSKWKWDDTNHTDTPIGTFNLTDGMASQELVGSTYLKINLLKIKDSNGKFQVVYPVDQDVSNAQNLTYLEEGANGFPRFYDKLGDLIYFYPKISSSLVTATDGGKVWFQRGASLFLASDTTKIPGFAAQFHRILSVGAALDYALANGMTNKVTMLRGMMDDL